MIPDSMVTDYMNSERLKDESSVRLW